MKYLKQFGIILLISFIGEMLNKVIPLPIPASIYGLLIMLIALITKILKLEDVKETGMFLVEIMPLMFIPAAVGLINIWGQLKAMIFPLVIITIFSTVIVMIVSGRVTQFIIKKEKKKEKR